MKDNIFSGYKGSDYSNIPEGENFFERNSGTLYDEIQPEPVRHLNDYDYNILKDDAYKVVPDELFKLEYKISRLESELESVETQIQAARDISDYDTVEFLLNGKRQLQQDLEELIKIYNDKSLSAKISGGIFNIISPEIKNRFDRLSNALNSFKEIILSNLPGKIPTVLELRKSLDKLESISRSVDELMTMQTPHGENTEKYNQLSKYITRANAIQSHIAKTLR